MSVAGWLVDALLGLECASTSDIAASTEAEAESFRCPTTLPSDATQQRGGAGLGLRVDRGLGC